MNVKTFTSANNKEKSDILVVKLNLVLVFSVCNFVCVVALSTVKENYISVLAGFQHY